MSVFWALRPDGTGFLQKNVFECAITYDGLAQSKTIAIGIKLFTMLHLSTMLTQ